MLFLTEPWRWPITTHDKFLIPLIVFTGDSLLGWETPVCGPGKPEASALLWYSCRSFAAHWAWISMAPLWRSQCLHPSAVWSVSKKVVSNHSNNKSPFWRKHERDPVHTVYHMSQCYAAQVESLSTMNTLVEVCCDSNNSKQILCPLK